MTTSAHAVEKTVWQIGQFDHNYAEFAIAGNNRAYRTAFPNGVVFRVGKDDPAKVWPYIQPGPSDVWAGLGPLRHVILFELPDQPKGLWTLTIAFVNTHPLGPPTYEVDINGVKSSTALPKGSADEALTDPSKDQEYTLTIPFPASVLHTGENRISLNSVDGSWAIYDALRLTNDSDAALPPVEIKDLNIVPTTRIIQENGKLKRIVKVTAHLSRGMTPGFVTIKTGAASDRYAIASDSNSFAQTEALIDDLSTPIQMEAMLSCESATKSLSSTIQPGKHWKLYIYPAIHVDIGYTDYQERVATVHTGNVTRALNLFDKYPDFKWNTESAWVEDNYLSTMPDNLKTEFIRRAKEGRMGCPAIYANMLTGICSHEGFIRNLYYAHGASKQYGIPFDMAVSCDVPTFVWTLPSVLAGSGIHYFAAGLNYGRDDITNRPMNMPFYWQGPDGGRVLTWFSPIYAWALRLGLLQSVESAQPNIDDFMRDFDRSDYACDAVFAYGAQWENGPLDASLASVTEAWNKKYVSPKIILCRGPEFFQYVQKNWKGNIPIISGDVGVCWEDGVASSAVETALARNSTEKLITAEKLNSLNAILGRTAVPKSEFDAAWKNAILWEEHTWGGRDSKSQPYSEQTAHQWKFKAALATNLSQQVDSLIGKGMATLSTAVNISEPSVMVYNPLNWPVSGPVEAKTSGGGSIIFRADNIPPMGYRVYSRKNLPSATASGAIYDSKNLTLSNKFYVIQIDRATGALRSIHDNELNRELLDTNAPYGANQYLYFSGKDWNFYNPKTNDNSRKDITQKGGPYPVTVSVEDRPAGKALIIKTSAYNTPEIISEILLRDDEKRLDITNAIDKKETLNNEAGYFAFPFKIDAPRFHVELPDGVLRPDTDSMPGGCMEWYCLQDFCAAENDDCAITWTPIDSPLVTLSSPNYSFTDHHRLIFDKGYMFAYVFSNTWGTNYKASQGGKMVFRFSMTSSRKYDQAASARFGQSARHPLLAVATGSGNSHIGSARRDFSAFSVLPASVEIQAVKQAENGQGIIVRLRELSGRPAKATVAIARGKFHEADLCNLMEDPQSKLKITRDKLTAPIAANALATVLLK
jgi:hypothetical protein